MLSSNNTAFGTVSGGGTYLYLDTVPIDANPTDHYHLVQWSDGNQDDIRDIVITSDLQLTATFAIDTHMVNVAVNDIARGMVESTGIEFEYGTPCTVTATAYTGYTFVGWSNGVTANPYNFAVLNDVELTAFFVAEGEESYTVTVVSADLSMGEVSGGGIALDGDTMTIRAMPYEGYHFLHWNDGDTNSVRIIEVHGDITNSAYFEYDNSGGIEDASTVEFTIAVQGHRIVVEGAGNQMVRVFDITGRQIGSVEGNTATIPASGVYFVKVGNYPARKVVVIR